MAQEGERPCPSVEFVDFEALNLGFKPILVPETRIEVLHLGHQVEDWNPTKRASAGEAGDFGQRLFELPAPCQRV